MFLVVTTYSILLHAAEGFTTSGHGSAACDPLKPAIFFRLFTVHSSTKPDLKWCHSWGVTIRYDGTPTAIIWSMDQVLSKISILRQLDCIENLFRNLVTTSSASLNIPVVSQIAIIRYRSKIKSSSSPREARRSKPSLLIIQEEHSRSFIPLACIFSSLSHLPV